MDIDEIAIEAKGFQRTLDNVKKEIAPTAFSWYPYGTLDNFHVLRSLLSGPNRNLLELAGEGGRIVDIGAADGDTALFLEHLGREADVVDYAPTNFNGCQGVRALKEALGSNVAIHEVDLDARFDLPGQEYQLAFFLGILYHLKNPFGALESLSRLARHALISTRITRFNTVRSRRANRVELSAVPVAYLVDPYETNNDPTNFWIFSDAGLRRVLARSGWDILDYSSFGNTSDSDPATTQGDERAFCLVRSRHFG